MALEEGGSPARHEAAAAGGIVRRRKSTETAGVNDNDDGNDGNDEEDLTFFDAYHTHSDVPSLLRRRSSVKRTDSMNSHFKFISRTFLQGRTVEISMLCMFVAALNHSDMLGLVYLGCAVYCCVSTRQQCKSRWILISSIFLIGLFAQYFAILR